MKTILGETYLEMHEAAAMLGYHYTYFADRLHKNPNWLPCVTRGKRKFFLESDLRKTINGVAEPAPKPVQVVIHKAAKKLEEAEPEW